MPAHAAAQGKLPIARVSSTISKRSVADESHTYSLCMVHSWSQDPTRSRLEEIPVQLDSAIRHVSGGNGWLCILTENGSVYSMGINTDGQLAQGHYQLVSQPARIAFPTTRRIAKLSCGSSHGGFVLNSGELFMFGCGSYGRLGTGCRVHTEPSPVHVPMQWSTLIARTSSVANERRSTLPGVQATACSSSTEPSTDPGDVADDTVVFIDISCGDRHTLTLATRPAQGKSVPKTHIIAFGDGMNGRLGVGSETDHAAGVLLTVFHTPSSSLVPSAIASSSSVTPSFTSISAGERHSAAVATTGELFTWGCGSDGQLGHGTTASEWTPRLVQHLKGTPIATVCCGSRHTVAVTRLGLVYAWGRGTEGQLGLNTDRNQCTPQRVAVHVDPLAAQQTQIEAQVTAGASFSSTTASTTNLMALQQDTRVVVRRAVAKKHTTVAVDEQSRLFVWGANSLFGTSQPQQVRWVDLRAAPRLPPRSSTLDDRLRSLPRVALTHVDACEAWCLLVFKTKMPVGLSGVVSMLGTESSVSNDDQCEPTSPVSPQLKRGAWQLSAVAPLPVDAISSREAAYRAYMANFKVRIRPPRSDSNRGSDQDDDPDYVVKRRPSRVNAERRVSTADSVRWPRRGSIAMLDQFTKTHRDVQPMTAAESVKGFTAWLEQRNNNHSTTTTTRPHTARPRVHSNTPTQPHSTTRSPRPAPTSIRSLSASARPTQTPRPPTVAFPHRPSTAGRSNRGRQPVV